MATVTDINFLRLQSHCNGDWSHEIKRQLLLWRKAMENLDSLLKSRDTILPTNIHVVKPMIFPVVTYGCENWIIKKAKHWRIDDFELWHWRTVESLLDCKIKPVNPKGYQPWIFIARTVAEAPILWPPDAKSQLWKRPWCWERLKTKGEGNNRGCVVEWHHPLNDHGFK